MTSGTRQRFNWLFTRDCRREITAAQARLSLEHLAFAPAALHESTWYGCDLVLDGECNARVWGDSTRPKPTSVALHVFLQEGVLAGWPDVAEARVQLAAVHLARRRFREAEIEAKRATVALMGLLPEENALLC